MGKIGHGYGSEWHLLRYLGYHRNKLNAAIKNKLNEAVKEEAKVTEVNWLDFDFSGKSEPLEQDKEHKRLDFLSESIPAQWSIFWPISGEGQNWDAVARLQFSDGYEEWLLVEAKAHKGELHSQCTAKSRNSITKIDQAIMQTLPLVGASDAALNVWTKKYYQYANRLAVLAFLNDMLPASSCVPPIPARLLYIYFYGDTRTGPDCPKNEASWKPTLEHMENALGIATKTPLMERVHHLFLNVGA